MNLIELLQSPWAVLPESLVKMDEIYAKHLAGEKIDIPTTEANLGISLSNKPRPYEVLQGGVAVLPIEGVIAPKANLFTQICGGVSAQFVQQQINQAKADSRVKSLIQVIDSPGGSVFGTPELAQAVREFAAVKPIVSISDGLMCSAAYWAGSAANAVFITGTTVEAGSIGVYARMSTGQGQAQTGSKEMVRGKYKRASINGEQVSAEYMAYMEAKLDHLYSVFVDAVASQRQVSADLVLEKMADGRVFTGQQALDAGLVDGISSLDGLVQSMATKPDAYGKRRKAVFATGAVAVLETVVLDAVGGVPAAADTPASEANPTEPVSLNPSIESNLGVTMDRTTLEREHPALFAQLHNDFVAQGAQSERDRIQAVRSQSLAGHEQLIEQLAFDGKTTGDQAASAVLAAENKLRHAAAQAHASDAPPAAKPSAAPPDEKPTAEQLIPQAHALVKAEGITLVEAYKRLGVK